MAICHICNKEVKLLGLSAHVWRMHTEIGRKWTGNVGKTGWNKGVSWDSVMKERISKGMTRYAESHPNAKAGANNGNYRGGLITSQRQGWKKAREAVWARDTVCRACLLPPHANRRLDVHHILPRRKGGSNDISNLVGLHHSCHMKVEVGKMTIVDIPLCRK